MPIPRLLSRPSDVTFTDRTLGAWRRSMMEQGLLHQWRMCEETGRIENLRRAAARGEGFSSLQCYDDSDVHKLCEGMAYAVGLGAGGEVRARLEEWADLVEQTQMDDGYVQSYIQLAHPDKRYLSLSRTHEMYVMGHLIEACCAYEEAVGDGKMLAVARKVGDHLDETFGPGKRKGYCGHQELELALARLAALTGDERYLALAKWMTDQRGTRPSPFEAEMRDDAARAFSGGYERLVMVGDDYDGAYFQDDKPLREQRSAVGHSVRAVYQFVGALDCYGGDDPSLLEALETIWETMVERRMYLTGGIGSAAQNEGFTKDYDLPNAEAYAETCAAIGLCLWGSRMALVTGEAKYYDVFERALYNNVLAGVSEDSTGYHYVNPLESLGRHKRKAWFDCACCPPNVARFLLSLERYLATSDDTSVSVHVAAGQVLRARPGGVAVEVEVESDYPWSGDVVVRVRAESPVRFALRVRQPGWASAGVCDGAELGADGYWRTDREWSSETELRLSWPMSVERILPHPKVTANQGRVAFMRGPLVYCLEERDLGAAAQRFVVGGDSPRVVSSEDPRSRVWLEVPGWLTQEGWEDAGLDASAVPKTRAVSLWRPYATWNNGGEPDGVGTMVVWAPAGPE